MCSVSSGCRRQCKQAVQDMLSKSPSKQNKSTKYHVFWKTPLCDAYSLSAYGSFTDTAAYDLLTMYINAFWLTDHRPVERGVSPSGRGKVYPGPATFRGSRHRSKILKRMFQMASFWPQICIKSVFGLGSAPDPAGGAYDAPPDPLDGAGTPVPTFPPRSWRIQNEIVIRPHDNGFPGPAVALGGPGSHWVVSQYLNLSMSRMHCLLIAVNLLYISLLQDTILHTINITSNRYSCQILLLSNLHYLVRRIDAFCKKIVWFCLFTEEIMVFLTKM